MGKCALSQRTIALIVFVFFLASFLQARNERHFRSAEWRVTGQGLSNSWNQPAERRINVVTAVSGPGSETTNCARLRWRNDLNDK